MFCGVATLINAVVVGKTRNLFWEIMHDASVAIANNVLKVGRKLLTFGSKFVKQIIVRRTVHKK